MARCACTVLSFGHLSRLSRERSDTGDRPPENQRVNIVCTCEREKKKRSENGVECRDSFAIKPARAKRSPIFSRTFVSVHRFQVHHVPDHMVLVRDPISAQHISRGSRDLQRFDGRVSLYDGNHFRRGSTAR